MTIASILDSIIAVILVITTASLLVTALYEIIGEILQRRAKRLYTTIKLSLDNSEQSTLTDYIFNHPLLESSWKGNSPWQPSDYFGRPVLPIFRGSKAPVNIDSQRLAQILLRFIQSPHGSKLETYPILKELWDASGNDKNKFLQEVPKWTEEIFQTISANNQQNRRLWYFGIGFVLCVLLNINVITISEKIAQKNDLSYLIDHAQILTGTEENSSDGTNLLLQQNAASYLANLLDLSVHIGLEPTNIWCDHNWTGFLELNDLQDVNDRAELDNKFHTYCGTRAQNYKNTQIAAKHLRCALDLKDIYHQKSDAELENEFKTDCASKVNSAKDISMSSNNLRCFLSIDEINKQNSDGKLKSAFEAYCDDNLFVKLFFSLKERLDTLSFTTILGYLLTALLLSFGSNFWLSLLKKSLSVRAYVYGGAKKAETTKD